MKRPENETKRKIIDVAVKMIKDEGYDKVTINDICRAAGVSKHTLYYYFKSKEEILNSYGEVPLGVRHFEIERLVTAENSFEKFFLTFSSLIDFFSEMGPELAKKTMGAKSEFKVKYFGDMSQDPRESFKQLQVSLIEQARKEGSIRNNSDAEALYYCVTSVVTGMIHFWVRNSGKFDIKDNVRYLLEIVLDVPENLRKSNIKTSDLKFMYMHGHGGCNSKD